MMEWRGTAWPNAEPDAWVLYGDYPQGVVWVYIEKLFGDPEGKFHYLIVYADRTYGEGYRYSLENAQSAVLNHLEIIQS